MKPDWWRIERHWSLLALWILGGMYLGYTYIIGFNPNSNFYHYFVLAGLPIIFSPILFYSITCHVSQRQAQICLFFLSFFTHKFCEVIQSKKKYIFFIKDFFFFFCFCLQMFPFQVVTCVYILMYTRAYTYISMCMERILKLTFIFYFF